MTDHIQIQPSAPATSSQ